MRISLQISMSQLLHKLKQNTIIFNELQSIIKSFEWTWIMLQTYYLWFLRQGLVLQDFQCFSSCIMLSSLSCSTFPMKLLSPYRKLYLIEPWSYRKWIEVPKNRKILHFRFPVHMKLLCQETKCKS